MVAVRGIGGGSECHPTGHGRALICSRLLTICTASSVMRAMTWLPVDPAKASATISDFEGYAKLQGMLRSRALGLPTLPGLVVNSLVLTDDEALNVEAQKLHPTRFLVR